MHLDWDELPAFARHEAGLDGHGDGTSPRLLLFHDRVPTVYVRARRPKARNRAPRSSDDILVELASIASWVHPTEAALVTTCVLNSADAPVRPALDPGATSALLVQRRWRDGDDSAGDTVLLERTCDDAGMVDFPPEPDPVPGGPFTDLLDACIGRRAPVCPPEERMDIGGVVYALTRFGHVLGVAEDWHDRFGLDRPVRASMVRPVDRDRARQLIRRHRRLQERARQDAERHAEQEVAS